MRGRGLLAAILLGVVLCFVPALRYGEIADRMFKAEVPYLDFKLLEARVDYVMRNPTVFLDARLWFGLPYKEPRGLPKGVRTVEKIIVQAFDSRNRFSYKSGVALLGEFKKFLEVIYSYIDHIATDMDTDIVAVFYTKEGIPLGYFYQGEYHLWGGIKKTHIEGSNRTYLLFDRCIHITLDIPLVGECIRTGSGVNELGEVGLERRNQR